MEEGEFFVEAIQEHMYYEQAFCLRNKIAFTPNCKNEIEHSKYVFLVVSHFSFINTVHLDQMERLRWRGCNMGTGSESVGSGSPEGIQEET